VAGTLVSKRRAIESMSHRDEIRDHCGANRLSVL